jgi:hypothetical protein
MRSRGAHAAAIPLRLGGGWAPLALLRTLISSQQAFSSERRLSLALLTMRLSSSESESLSPSDLRKSLRARSEVFGAQVGAHAVRPQPGGPPAPLALQHLTGPAVTCLCAGISFCRLLAHPARRTYPAESSESESESELLPLLLLLVEESLPDSSSLEDSSSDSLSFSSSSLLSSAAQNLDACIGAQGKEARAPSALSS